MSRRKGLDAKEEEKAPHSKSFLEAVPFLGGLVRGLSKTGPFKKRFGEVDRQIGDNLRKGEKKEPAFEVRISARPIIEEATKGAGEFIGDDCKFEMRGDKLLLTAKVPQKEVHIELKGKTLKLQAEKWKKMIELPGRFSKLASIRNENGFLVLELAK
ncbi:hypothetical protein HYY74_07150 [Candidatus Woesearchaeota archaeon]|nr:hypothetical protein [Candidatus Woesearchaeota archaeon]